MMSALEKSTAGLGYTEYSEDETLKGARKVGRPVKRQLQYSGQESILAWTMMGMQMYKICGQILDIFHMYI